MAFEKLRTIVITAIPKPRSRERFRKIAETTPTRDRCSRRAKNSLPLIGGMQAEHLNELEGADQYCLLPWMFLTLR
jgi:hypothetical protein